MSSKGENKSNLTRDEARILLTLNEKSLTVTKPVQSEDTLAYQGLEELAKEHPGKKIHEILKSLLKKGYLNEVGYNDILVCPSCGSYNLLTSYCCPRCQSRKIRKSKLAEHKLCGYIGNLDDFQQDNGYICPKCKTQITKSGTDPTIKQDPTAEVLKIIGSSFVCDTCKAKFEKPSILHTCSDCDSSFPNNKANHTKIPTYEVVKKLEPEILSQTIIPQPIEQKVEEKPQTAKPAHEPVTKSQPEASNEVIKRIESAFKKRGFTFQYGYKLRGKSGFEQSFDVAAQKGEQTVLIDVSRTGDQADLIGLVGKKKDVDAGSIILLDITGNPNLVSLGKQYAIIVIDGRSNDYTKQIAEILSDKGGD